MGREVAQVRVKKYQNKAKRRTFPRKVEEGLWKLEMSRISSCILGTTWMKPTLPLTTYFLVETELVGAVRQLCQLEERRRKEELC